MHSREYAQAKTRIPAAIHLSGTREGGAARQLGADHPHSEGCTASQGGRCPARGEWFAAEAPCRAFEATADGSVAIRLAATQGSAPAPCARRPMRGALWSAFNPARSICSRRPGGTFVPVAVQKDAERPGASGAAFDSDREPYNRPYSTARHGYPKADTSRVICFGTGCSSWVGPPGVGQIVAGESASSQ